jgi:hypothetical protein
MKSIPIKRSGEVQVALVYLSSPQCLPRHKHPQSPFGVSLGHPDSEEYLEK